MAKKYIKCTKCDTDTPLNYSKYCDECRLQISLDNLQKAGYKPKDRACRKCNETFFAIGPSAVHCSTCASEIHKEKVKITMDNYRRRKGINVGVGSGNNPWDENHGSYGNQFAVKSRPDYGTKNYRKFAREVKGNTCEKCNILLDFTVKWSWCIHHKDRNRKNNNINNLELLCRKCHAIEHKCNNHLIDNGIV